MMEPETKAAWVAALRSGAFEQGVNQLVSVKSDEAPKYCCLGVLCETLGVEKTTLKYGTSSGKVVFSFGSGMGGLYAPPIFVYEGWGLSGGVISELISLNDTDKRSFSEIADHIEDHCEI